MPEGETRDWVFYLLLGGCAGAYLAIALLGRHVRFAAPRTRARIMACTHGLVVYAAISVTLHFVMPMLALFWWLWVAVFVLAMVCTRGQGLTLAERGFVFWLLLSMISLCFAVICRDNRMGFSLAYPVPLYAAPFVASLVFVAFVLGRKGFEGPEREVRYRAVRVAMHVLAFYVLALPCWRTEFMLDGPVIHHWKAFLESAVAVRSGGWLLWDVPSQYGFLQTLVIAFFPAATAWQSFYVLNGALQLAVNYAIFTALFARYRSGPGFVFSVVVAAVCGTCVLPGMIPNVVYPSTGVMRFFWAYVMSGYVFYLSRRVDAGKLITARFLWLGHGMWMAGVLWAVDSASYATIVWIPTLALLAYGEVSEHFSWGRWVRRTALRLAAPTGLAVAVLGVMIAAYWVHVQSLPDFSMFTVYAVAYRQFLALPMTSLRLQPAWIAMFLLLVVLAKHVVTHAPAGIAGGMHIAAVSAGAFAVWMCASYFVPFSEDYHLSGTLPLIVFVCASSLRILPNIAVPALIKVAFEKGVFCLMVVILLGGVAHLDPQAYTRKPLLEPIDADVTSLLPPPPPALQALIDEAHIPDYASVQVIYGPEALEKAYYHGMHYKPWLLPNTMVCFVAPLPVYTYQLIAERRAQTADDTAWLIEAKAWPLGNVSWVEHAILNYYNQAEVFENEEWRIRRFESKRAKGVRPPPELMPSAR